jgi:hypothetical protein
MLFENSSQRSVGATQAKNAIASATVSQNGRRI